jgi:3-deoxy-7-phosphoheptulonate synthase
MLIVMKREHTAEELAGVEQRVKALGFSPHTIPGESSVVVGVTGNRRRLDPQEFLQLPGVAQAIPVTKAYKLASRDFHKRDVEIKVGGAVFGPGRFVLLAGPCAVESEEQTVRLARKVKAAGAHILRGGAFKPRSSPYSFQGLGLPGLQILATARQETGLPVVTEALDPRSLEQVYEYADIIQIGARNMQNFSLLQECGRLDKPVMLKRGMSATLEEWLQAAEYVLEQGNRQVILCERGVRSFDSAARNMLDLTAVSILRELSPLPVIVDPSHGTGRRQQVGPMALGALAVGASGVMVDVHDRPEEALCDGPQALLPEDYQRLVAKLRQLAAVMDLVI